VKAEEALIRHISNKLEKIEKELMELKDKIK
jgi:hypothetical protein